MLDELFEAVAHQLTLLRRDRRIWHVVWRPREYSRAGLYLRLSLSQCDGNNHADSYYNRRYADHRISSSSASQLCAWVELQNERTGADFDSSSSARACDVVAYSQNAGMKS